MSTKQELRVLGAVAIGALFWLASKPAVPEVPAGPVRVGIPPDWFDSVSAAQQLPNWCWAACVEMILNWHHVPTNQHLIVTYVFGAPINEPGTDESISRTLNGWARSVDGRIVTVQSVVFAGAPHFELLIRELGSGRPILCAYDPGTGSSVGHAVVVTEAEYELTPQGVRLTSIAYRDPYPTAENISNRGRVELVGDDARRFVSNTRSHWLVSAS
jgi:hypothetical protein